MAENKKEQRSDNNLDIEDIGLPLEDADHAPIPLDEVVPENNDSGNIDPPSAANGVSPDHPDEIYAEIVEDGADELIPLAMDDTFELVEELEDTEEFGDDLLPISELQTDADSVEGASENAPADETAEANATVLGEEEKIDQILEALTDIKKEFTSKLQYDSHKEKIIDALHQELQEHKNNLVRKLMMSSFKDIIKIIDDIRKMTNHFIANQIVDSDPDRILRFLEAVPGDLEDTLGYQGVNAFTSESSKFDPSRQRVMNRVATANPELDKTIAERLRPGYEVEDHIIRPELVNVFVFQSETASAETRSPDE